MRRAVKIYCHLCHQRVRPEVKLYCKICPICRIVLREYR